MRIVVLSGGVGGAKFTLGVKAALGWEPFGDRPNDASDDITVIVNTADDIRLHGLQICPDLDSCMYTLAGVSDLQRGWGQRDESWTISGELTSYGEPGQWFSLGDRDFATHLVRSRLLSEGSLLSEVTASLCARHRPGVRLLPMTNDSVTTTVDVTSSAFPEQTETLHFQEWWVKHRAQIAPLAFSTVGAEASAPAPGVLEALANSDVILLAPSNPVVSINPILRVPGIRDALRASSAPIVGVSPIIGGAPVRGHADLCLRAIGVPCSAEGVGNYYGARAHGGLLDGFLVAPGERFTMPGVQVQEAPLIMSNPAVTADIVIQCLRIAGNSEKGSKTC